MTLHHTKFRVRGRRYFPTILLHLEACYPASVEDAANIAESVRKLTPTVIDLVHVGRKADWRPNELMWETHGWHCVEEA